MGENIWPCRIPLPRGINLFSVSVMIMLFGVYKLIYMKNYHTLQTI